MRLSDIVGARLAEIIQSPASTYTGGAVSATSGVGTLVDPHNVIFIIGTFGGLLFAWLTYRSRTRKDREMTILARRNSDAFIEYLQSSKVTLNSVDDAPDVVKKAMDAIKNDVTFKPGRREDD